MNKKTKVYRSWKWYHIRCSLHLGWQEQLQRAADMMNKEDEWEDKERRKLEEWCVWAKKENWTCNLRNSGPLCSPLRRSTGTTSNSTSFSRRHTSTLLAEAEWGPYTFTTMFWFSSETLQQEWSSERAKHNFYFPVTLLIVPPTREIKHWLGIKLLI